MMAEWWRGYHLLLPSLDKFIFLRLTVELSFGIITMFVTCSKTK